MRLTYMDGINISLALEDRAKYLHQGGFTLAGDEYDELRQRWDGFMVDAPNVFELSGDQDANGCS